MCSAIIVNSWSSGLHNKVAVTYFKALLWDTEETIKFLKQGSLSLAKSRTEYFPDVSDGFLLCLSFRVCVD
jgi:hypothetical protein